MVTVTVTVTMHTHAHRCTRMYLCLLLLHIHKVASFNCTRIYIYIYIYIYIDRSIHVLICHFLACCRATRTLCVPLQNWTGPLLPSFVRRSLKIICGTGEVLGSFLASRLCVFVRGIPYLCGMPKCGIIIISHLLLGFDKQWRLELVR